jgi:hypothetical protein
VNDQSRGFPVAKPSGSSNLSTVPASAMSIHEIIGTRLDHPMMARLEVAAAKGPQWIECEECRGTGQTSNDRFCPECAGAGGYMTNPSLALERMRRMLDAEPLTDVTVKLLSGGRSQVSG